MADRVIRNKLKYLIFNIYLIIFFIFDALNFAEINTILFIFNIFNRKKIDDFNIKKGYNYNNNLRRIQY
jgi:hypothetical protein